MKLNKYICCLAGLICILICSCQKYDTLQPISNAAYVRMFNGIVNYDTRAQVTGTVKDLNSLRLLCVLVDPKQDASGRLSDALITSDFMGGRAFYAAPYETHPNDIIRSYYNTEYPGAYRVRSGGTINGLDLSRWAQIQPGTHRVVVMRRVANTFGAVAYYTDFTPQAKDTACRVMLDTTVTLSEGSVYTFEVVNRFMTDAQPLQLIVRRESLDRQNFAADSMYVNFYNYLQAAGTPAALDVYYQTEYVIQTTHALRTEISGGGLISYSEPTNTDPILGYTSMKTSEKRVATITEKFAATAPYIAIPMPAIDSFYYTEGPALGQFRLPLDRPHTVFNFYLPGQSAATGAKPYIQLLGTEYNAPKVLNAGGDQLAQFVSGDERVPLYQTVTVNKVARPFPMVNTITLMNRVAAINQPAPAPTAYQVSLQRPFEAAFIQ